MEKIKHANRQDISKLSIEQKKNARPTAGYERA